MLQSFERWVGTKVLNRTACSHQRLVVLWSVASYRPVGLRKSENGGGPNGMVAKMFMGYSFSLFMLSSFRVKGCCRTIVRVERPDVFFCQYRFSKLSPTPKEAIVDDRLCREGKNHWETSYVKYKQRRTSRKGKTWILYLGTKSFTREFRVLARYYVRNNEFSSLKNVVMKKALN